MARRRWIQIISAAGVILFVGFAKLYFIDDSPPEDEFMMPLQSQEGGVSPNPLTLFQEKTRNIQPVEMSDLSDDARSYRIGTEPELETFLTRHAALHSEFDQLLKSTSPKWKIDVQNQYATTWIRHRHLLDGANLAQIRTYLLVREGKSKEGVQYALDVLSAAN